MKEHQQRQPPPGDDDDKNDDDDGAGGTEVDICLLVECNHLEAAFYTLRRFEKSMQGISGRDRSSEIG